MHQFARPDMRLWTVHPKYLDARGLVAVWREALLAQKVLAGSTHGYTRHPQLTRFRAAPKPVAAVAAFLFGVAAEAERRGYSFSSSKISQPIARGQIIETDGQLIYEWRHLKRKLKLRSPHVYLQHRAVRVPEAHPLFRIVPGHVQAWEKK